ncbi:Beta-lactamase-like protein [Naviculisporaceae sp. PSN 640]
MPPTFATPLPQSTRSEILEWRFPKPFSHYVLTGRSRAAWHTSFVIPALNLLLDAGLVVNNLRPKHIFITHGHNDHVLLAPAFVKRSDPPDIVMPKEMATIFNEFIKADRLLNLGGHITVEEADAAYSDDEEENESNQDASSSTNPTPTNPKEKDPYRPFGFLATHITRALSPGDIVPLKRTPNITAQAFKCDHSVPTLGYVFRQTTSKLKPEYQSLPGQQLKSLRESGTEITCPVTTPIFAFLGDTTARTLLDEPEWLKGGIPVVITECSFLREEHRPQAEKTRHTIWMDLERVIRKWPGTTFVLMHFSMRYSEGEVRRFFRDLVDPPGNMVVWIDGFDE